MLQRSLRDHDERAARARPLARSRRGADFWEEYSAIAGDATLDAEALEHYRQGWDLADIAAFVAEFRRPHEEDANTAASFAYLCASLNA